MLCSSRMEAKKTYSKIRGKHPMSIWVRNLGELWLRTDSRSVNQCPSRTTERRRTAGVNEQRTFLLASYWKEWVAKTAFTSTIANLYLPVKLRSCSKSTTGLNIVAVVNKGAPHLLLILVSILSKLELLRRDQYLPNLCCCVCPFFTLNGGIHKVTVTLSSPPLWTSSY